MNNNSFTPTIPQLLEISSNHPDWLPLLELNTQFGHKLTGLSTENLKKILAYCSLRIAAEENIINYSQNPLQDAISYLEKVSTQTLFKLIMFLFLWLNDRQIFAPTQPQCKAF